MQVTLPVWVRKEAQAGRNQSSDDGQELRVRHEDAVSHPHDHGAHERLTEAVGGYLEHLDGLHADPELPIGPMTETPPRPALEPTVYERRAMGVHE